MVAAAAVGTPTAAVGDAADLLDVDVDHVAGPAGDDPSWCAVALTGRVEEPAPVQPEVGQVPADGPHRDDDAVIGEFEGDAPGRPFLLSAQALDPGDDLRCGGSGLAVRDARAVQQTALTELAVAVHPFAGTGAGDAHLGSDVGDRTSLTSLDEPSTAFTDNGALGCVIAGTQPASIGSRRASIDDREELGPLSGVRGRAAAVCLEIAGQRATS
ncbi:hypothetical protein GS860_06255 [Rhodococcus hoagii]|nr:hypothetical protein [Prescottella equi]